MDPGQRAAWRGLLRQSERRTAAPPELGRFGAIPPAARSAGRGRRQCRFGRAPGESCTTKRSGGEVRIDSDLRPSAFICGLSEVNFQGQLNLPPGVARVRYLAELRGAQSHSRIAETRLVQSIERLTA